MPGVFLSGCDYVQATRWRGLLSLQMEECLSRCDALLLPTTVAPAGRIEDVSPTAFLERPSFTTPASVAGLPALNLCCGFSKGGMPVGVQLIGRRFDEATLLKIGDAYERATSWRHQRPEMATL
jgi:aspartyl-tRNA(Asn)/glutamyl-tRNA(Gln) amidotransferase subunit A